MNTFSSGGTGLSTAPLPTVSEAAGALSVSKVGIAVAAVAVAAIVIFSLTSPDGPQIAGPHPLAGVNDSEQAPGRSGEENRGAELNVAARGQAEVGENRSATIAGRVLAPDGRPARGALVRVFEGEGRLPYEYAVTLAVTKGPVSEAIARRIIE